MESTVSRQWRAVLTFYAETPTDELEADDMADQLTDYIKQSLPGTRSRIFADSVAVTELDTVPIGEES